MKIYKVFYPNLPQKVITNPLKDQVNKSLPLVTINNEKKWEIEKILDARTCKKKVQ